MEDNDDTDNMGEREDNIDEGDDNPVSSRHNKCNNPLSILKKRKNGAIAVSYMLYPKPSIYQQLSMLYQQPNFENMMKLSGV
jgi:hypothetical protein